MEPAGRVEDLEAELKALQFRLTESYHMASLGRLLAGIVHEINTPIGSIVSNNEVLGRSLRILRSRLDEQINTGTPPAAKTLQILDTLVSLSDVDRIACDRILGVIRGLKTFARADSSELCTSDVNALIAAALKLSSCEYRRRVEIVTDYGELPEIPCYPQLLSQAFLNLIVNAAQAIEGEGKITVRTRVALPDIEIQITDTGKGIAPENRSRIFRQGFTTKPIGVGTGLGLAITHQIITEHHRGSIEFESEVGQGTTFRIRIPITPTKQ